MKGNKFVQRRLFTFTLSSPSVRADLMNKGWQKNRETCPFSVSVKGVLIGKNTIVGTVPGVEFRVTY